MDRIYRHQRHVYDLTRRWYLLGRDRLVEALNPPPGGAVLELGCGTARNLIAAARAWPDARFYGLDVSAEMLATAARNIRRAGLEHHILLGKGDATAFDARHLFGCERFERVFFSYSLSMIPPWREALEHAFAVTAPGGELHVVDFGQLERLPAWFRRLLYAWLERFEVHPRADLAGQMKELARAFGGSFRAQSLYRGYATSTEVTLPFRRD